MSREVIDDVPPEWAPAAPTTAASLDVPDAAQTLPPVYAQQDTLVADLAEDVDADVPAGWGDEDDTDGPGGLVGPGGPGVPGRRPGSGAGGGPARFAAAPQGNGWQRPVALWVMLVAAGLTLLLGLAAGAAQGRGGERYDRLASTRIVVSIAAFPNGSTMGQQRVKGDLMAISTGGTVQLTELRTPFGAIVVRPAVTLTNDRMTTFPVDVLADCSTFEQYRDGTPPKDLTGTALVKDRPDDRTTRSVGLDFSPEVWALLMYVPCSTALEGATPTDASSTDSPTSSNTPAIGFSSMSVRDDGALTMTVRMLTPPPQPLRVDVSISPLLEGKTAGHFELTKIGLPSTVTNDGEEFTATVQLTYHCQNGTQVLPFLEDVLQATVTTTDGQTADGIGLDVLGWNPNTAAQAIRRTMARAGCPSDDTGTPAPTITPNG